MARPLTTDQIQSILDLKHLPQRTIAKRVGVSLFSVSKALKGAKQEEPKQEVIPPAVHVEDVVAVAEQLVAEDVTNESELRGCLGRLAVAGKIAEKDKDVARMVSVERVKMQILTQLEKLKPPAPVDANAQPDMVEAARRFREQMHSMLDRILKDVPG